MTSNLKSSSTIIKPLQQSVALYDPAWYGKADSYGRWVPLTIADIQHALRATEHVDRFARRTFLFGNHPIRYVSIVAILIGHDVFGRVGQVGGGNQGGTVRHVLHLDDGSGETIEATGTGETFDIFDNNEDTTGRMFKIKGIIGDFRGSRQVEIERLRLFKRREETRFEIAFWNEVAQYRETILSKPWVLTDEDKEEELKAQRDLAASKARKKEKKASSSLHGSRTAVAGSGSKDEEEAKKAEAWRAVKRKEQEQLRQRRDKAKRLLLANAGQYSVFGF